MRLLKLIPAAAIALTAFATFETKAGYPSGWTEKNKCLSVLGEESIIYKLQNTDTPAAWGTYDEGEGDWVIADHSTPIEYVSYDCAHDWWKYKCGARNERPTCTS